MRTVRPFANSANPLLYENLVLGVSEGSGLVQNDDGRLLADGAGESYALLLAA